MPYAIFDMRHSFVNRLQADYCNPSAGVGLIASAAVLIRFGRICFDVRHWANTDVRLYLLWIVDDNRIDCAERFDDSVKPMPNGRNCQTETNQALRHNTRCY